MTNGPPDSAALPSRWKWFFAYNGSYSDVYDIHIRVMVRSALANTSIDPHFLYCGPQNDSRLGFLRSHGVKVIHHTPSILPALERTKARVPHYPLHIASGAFMRIDVPLVCRDLGYDDDVVLYTDCDVVFNRDIPRDPSKAFLRPTFFSAAPQHSQTDLTDMNSGVMIMNVKNLLHDHSSFAHSITSGDRLHPELVTQGFDQGAYRTYYASRWDHLPLEYNWKPYWGINDDAVIVHFHGVKIKYARAMMKGNTHGINEIRQRLFRTDPDAYSRYLARYEKYM